MDNQRSAIILAAGKGTRLDPLTRTQPKALITIIDKTVIEHTLSNLNPYIDEAIIIVHTFHEQIETYLGDSYQGIRLTYVYQDEPLGTGHAVQAASQYVNHDKLFIVYGDDLYDPNFYKQLVDHQTGIIAVEVQNWQNYGIFQLKNNKYLLKLIEKPKEFVGNLANPGVYLVTREIFEYFENITKTDRGELEFTDTISLYGQDNPIEVIAGEGYWLPIGYPWDLLRASQYLLKLQKPDTQGTVESDVQVNGKLYLGKNSVIKTGAIVEGDFWIGDNVIVSGQARLLGYGVISRDVTIGENTLISEAIIGRSSTIGNNVNIANTIIGKQVQLSDNVSIDNSIEENHEVFMQINGKATPTGGKFGAIIGDQTHIEHDTHVKAGLKIAPHSHITANSNILVDIE